MAHRLTREGIEAEIEYHEERLKALRAQYQFTIPREPDYEKQSAPTANTTRDADKLALSAREAARLLSICERTLFSLTRSGRVKCVRVGQRVLYRREALIGFLHAAEDEGEKPRDD